MAGPLTGIGGQQQQIPIANTFQPGGRENEVREQRGDGRTERTRENSDVRRGNTAERADSRDTQSARRVHNARTAEAGNNNGQEQRRGSLVDVTV